jgi:hypothetical protein
LTPTADSYVDASQPTVNFGTSAQLRVDGSPVVRSYLTFNVTGVSGTVTSATLRVFATSAQSLGYDAYSVADTSWGETTITDANAPPFGATKLGSSGKVTANTWTSVDVTSAVTGNGLVSFGLSTTNSTALALSSRTGANPPQLVVGWSGLAVVGPPALPSRPNPLLVTLFLLIPVLAPALVLLNRAPGRRALNGSRSGQPEPGWLALARMAFTRRMRASIGSASSRQSDGAPS